MLRPGQVIALAAIALLTLGVVMVNSAAMSVQSAGPEGVVLSRVSFETIAMSRSAVYMALAVIALGVGAFVPVRSFAERFGRPEGFGHAVLAKVGMAGLALIVVCALAYVPGIARPMNGSHRWIQLPVPGLGDALSMQPSEIAKWAMIPLVAWYACSRRQIISEFWRGLVPALVLIGAVSGFVVLEDLGTGVLIASVACLMLLAGGARFWQFFMFVPVGLAGVVGAIVTSEYRMKRILAFADPFADPQGIGYHTIQSLAAVASGGGTGQGLGHSVEKFGYLPEDKTDFIFAIICAELGIAGAALVAALFCAILWAGYAVMTRERSPFLRLISLGVVATIAVQAVINLAVVTGLAPTKGIALPLLSSGGTGWILTAFSLGLVVSIDRTRGRVSSPVGPPAFGAGLPSSPVSNLQPTPASDVPATQGELPPPNVPVSLAG